MAGRRAQKQASDHLWAKTKELERSNCQLEKEFAEANVDAEMLKNPCTSLCDHTYEMRGDTRESDADLCSTDAQGTWPQRGRVLRMKPLGATARRKARPRQKSDGNVYFLSQIPLRE